MTLDQARDLLTRALLVISPLHQIHGEIATALQDTESSRSEIRNVVSSGGNDPPAVTTGDES
jgi:hypothetical protein